MKCLSGWLLLLVSTWWVGCTSSAVSPRQAAPAAPSKEELYREGHALYAREEFGAAAELLQKSSAMDTLYEPPLVDLASLFYDWGMREKAQNVDLGREHLRRSAWYFTRLLRAGRTEQDVYERLCEIAVDLADTAAFVVRAQEYALHYPYDRQYYNLGVAYYEAARYQDVIRSMKEAVAKFPQSPYTSSYYRQLGYAYLKVDRHQTAERTLYTGLKAIEGFPDGSAGLASPETLRRIRDDRIAMLLALRKLHRIYDATDKLQDVERQLKEAGYRD